MYVTSTITIFLTTAPEVTAYLHKLCTGYLARKNTLPHSPPQSFRKTPKEQEADGKILPQFTHAT